MPWHGLSPVESLNLWNEFGWQPLCYYTLCEVAESDDAPEDTRILALTSLNHFANRGILPVPMDESVPVFICNTLCQMSAPRPKRGWWARRRAQRRGIELAARLQAARTILLSIENQREAMTGTPQPTLPEKLPS